MKYSSSNAVVDLEGVQGVRSNPPLWLNYFNFMGEFMKRPLKCTKQTPLNGFEPLPHRNPGSTLVMKWSLNMNLVHQSTKLKIHYRYSKF